MPHRLGWAKVHWLRLYRLKLYGLRLGVGGQGEIIYSSMSGSKDVMSWYREMLEYVS